jgi:hypothetical protein
MTNRLVLVAVAVGLCFAWIPVGLLLVVQVGHHGQTEMSNAQVFLLGSPMLLAFIVALICFFRTAYHYIALTGCGRPTAWADFAVRYGGLGIFSERLLTDKGRYHRQRVFGAFALFVGSIVFSLAYMGAMHATIATIPPDWFGIRSVERRS